jgi:sugar/nucleoside kinase (ribokinase family)
MSSQILVVGKISYVIKFIISDDLTNLISKDRTKNSTVAKDSIRSFDGMAANIAYGLTFFNTIPILVSQVGRDFDWFYRPHLEKRGINLKLFIDQENETACSYILEDEKTSSFRVEQDNSYRFFPEKDLDKVIQPNEIQDLSVAFIGTGKAEADTKFISELYDQKKNLPLIYSPDNNIDQLSKWRLSQIFEKITILISTEEELKQIEERMKQSRNEIISASKRLKYIITMINLSKIIIYSKKFKIKISEAPAEGILSADHWQDVFRTGIIYGVSERKPIDEAAKLGSSLASYSVEHRENQAYSPSLEQITLRSYEVKSIKKKN